MGAGHVSLATAQVARLAGFRVQVVDDRAEFAHPDRFPHAESVAAVDDFENALAGRDLGPDDYVVIVTRGHRHDREVLAQALKTKAGYIGMIGSSRKRRAIYEALLAEGFTQNDLDRVYSPIGLSIGAQTPEEIGISIVAQLVQVRAGA
jgi:xanthine dehydrogenase accessory factor